MFAVHPGVIQTNLFRHFPVPKQIVEVTSPIFTDKTVAQGAATTMFAICAKGIETLSGSYLSDCDVKEPTTGWGKDASGELRERLWEVTEQQISEVIV